MSHFNSTRHARRAARILLLLLPLLATLVSLLQPQPTFAALDVPAMLYSNREQGKYAPLTLVPPTPLPPSLQSRLASVGTKIDFAMLSPPLQRALLWDAGLVLNSPGTQYVQLRTRCGKTMGDIFVSKDTITQVANCSLAVCNAQILAFAFPNCSATAVAPQTRCAVAIDDAERAAVQVKTASTLWSEEGVVEDATDFRLFVYDIGPSGPNGSNTTLYTLNQLPTFALRSERTDASNDAATATLDSGTWCIPTPGHLALLWLAAELEAPARAAEHRKWVQIATVFIALFALASLVGVGFASRAWSRRATKMMASTSSAASQSSVADNDNDNARVSAAEPLAVGSQPYYAILPSRSGGDDDAISFDNDAIKPLHQRTTLLETNISAADVARVNTTLITQSTELAAFVSDNELLVCAIAFESLALEDLIARGASGEVWRGHYSGQPVAVKRLVGDLRHDVRALELFTREIRLASALEHANIVTFVGVTWRTLFELSMVSELLPAGDLAQFLQGQESRTLTWHREKRAIAADIANALVYLHSLRPVIIHRDLKSLNVLLTQSCDAKLSDFGLSRERSIDETMTMGVGTMLWTAPEVLRGDRYDEKADIYSFGVVLSELDTCLPPYALNSELNGETGTTGIEPNQQRRMRAKSVELLPLIRRGKIVPQFSPTCPPSVLALAHACLQQDPERRPNAMQLVYVLQSKLSQSLES